MMKKKEPKAVRPEPLLLLQGIPHLKNSFIAGPNEGNVVLKDLDQNENAQSNAESQNSNNPSDQNDGCVAFSVPERSEVPAEIQKQMQHFYGMDSERSNYGPVVRVVTPSEIESIANQYPVQPVQQAPPAEPEKLSEEEMKKRQEEAFNNSLATLYQLWDGVRANPRDFDRWTNLLEHAEAMVVYNQHFFSI